MDSYENDAFKLCVLGLFETLWICEPFDHKKYNRTFDESVKLYAKFGDTFSGLLNG